MQKSYSDSYKKAGVDVTKGYESIKLMKSSIEETYSKDVLGSIGGFGGLYNINSCKDMENPILVSGTDGVGTKLKVAFLMEKFDTIGQDCVAMCVNDIICCGAKPLFFLDYIATGKLVPKNIATIVSGISKACKNSGCSLIGGETAEMPGFYKKKEFDLAGFSVGVVDKDKIINKDDIKIGDKVIGIASSGVHSNGFSLVRKVFNLNKENINEYIDDLKMTLGECLLTPTKLYVKPILKLIEEVKVHGISHITGGGFYENMPRMLREDTAIKLDISSYQVPKIFKLIEERGNITLRDMYNTFNMGIGMAVIVSKEDQDKTIKLLESVGEKAYIIGEIIEGNKEININF